MKSSKKSTPAPLPRPTPGGRIAAFAVAAAVAAIPIALWPWAADSYRLPKAMLFRATAIVVFAIAVMEIVWTGRLRRLGRPRDRFVILSGAVVAWWGLSAAAASNRHLSLVSWLWVASGAVIALATYHLAPAFKAGALVPLIAGGVVNAASCLLSFVVPASPLWPQSQGRAHAFLGSAHDAGAFLAIPALVATIAAFADRRRRIWWAAAAVLCVGAIITTRTEGAVIAYAGGMFVFVMLRSVRSAVVLALAAVVVALALPQTRARIAPLRSGDVVKIDRMLSGRILPFMAAGRMFVQHPILGVGPGCFAWEYFPQKIALEGDYPVLLRCMTRDIQFGETHNDHLQFLAETGLPGYLLFLTALALVTSASRRRPIAPDRWQARFAQAAGAPLAATIAVLSLVEFPFEIAAASMPIIYSAALFVGWSRTDESD